MDSLFLRRVLLADALVSGAAGVAMIVGAGLLAPLLALPQALLVVAGFALMPWTLALTFLSRMVLMPRNAVRAAVAVNIAWVLGSIVVLLAFGPSLFGYAFVIAQAVAVGVFAELQIVALKREPARA
ncbi:MAG TPA: hypothetical protein VEA80_06095 [Vitreimonas sp.]|uniref:hypothetical protein n=1 Tax=Vitreimonas sp. TaxID=3069702 RepID=UPI002D722400|nr:hypothetical protein [Vitreimonas sp.]HYD87024.1 hypothetical protein [Vitreimonas sp.]